MELFSEVYSNYYTAVRRILEAGQEGPLCAADLCRIIDRSAFADSCFYMMPCLTGGEWDLLSEEGGKIYPKTHAKKLNLPLTTLQKSWLKALLSDRRISLFLTKSEIQYLNQKLDCIQPLFYHEDFHYFDQALDGDPYEDEEYQERFRIILQALRKKSLLKVQYHGGKNVRMLVYCKPVTLSYSQKDDKFRIEAIWYKAGRKKKMTFNVSRLESVEIIERMMPATQNREDHPDGRASVLLQIMRERNALERCLVQFASMEKQTEYNPETDEYTCRIFYDGQDETEMIIRILSFGPVVKVLEPEPFLAQMRERIKKQMGLMSK